MAASLSFVSLGAGIGVTSVLIYSLGASKDPYINLTLELASWIRENGSGKSSDIIVLPRFLHFSHVQNIGHSLRIICRRRHLCESRSPKDDGLVPVACGRRVAPYGVLNAGMDDLSCQLRHRILRGDPLRQRW